MVISICEKSSFNFYILNRQQRLKYRADRHLLLATILLAQPETAIKKISISDVANDFVEVHSHREISLLFLANGSTIFLVFTLFFSSNTVQ